MEYVAGRRKRALMLAAVLSLAGCSSANLQTGHTIGAPKAPFWSRFKLPGASASHSLAENIIPEDPEPKNLKHPTRTRLAYARWQESIGNFSEAGDKYRMILDNDPRSIEATIGLARIDYLAGRKAEAEQGFAKVLEAAPNDPQVHDAAGQFYAAEKRYDEAIEHLNTAMLGAPADANYRYHLAVALARSGDTQAALPHFAKTVGEAEACYNVGYVLFEEKQYAKAEQYLLQAVTMKPELAKAQDMLEEVRRIQDTDSIARMNGPRNVVTTSGARAQAAGVSSAHALQRRGVAAAPSAADRVQPAGASNPGAMPSASLTDPHASGGMQIRPAETFRALRTDGPTPSVSAQAAPALPRPSLDHLTPQQREQLQNQAPAR